MVKCERLHVTFDCDCENVPGMDCDEAVHIPCGACGPHSWSRCRCTGRSVRRKSALEGKTK